MCISCEINKISPYQQTELCKLKELNDISIEDFKTLICKKNYFHVVEQIRAININLAMNYKVNNIMMKYTKRVSFDFSNMKN
jgi:hypothetical protein